LGVIIAGSGGGAAVGGAGAPPTGSGGVSAAGAAAVAIPRRHATSSTGEQLRTAESRARSDGRLQVLRRILALTRPILGGAFHARSRPSAGYRGGLPPPPEGVWGPRPAVFGTINPVPE